MRTVILVAAAFALVSGTARSEVVSTRHADVLTSLPAIGTVYWRSECKRSGTRWSIGLRTFRVSATTQLTFRAGRARLTRTVQPAQTVWFPFTAAKLQRLQAVQGTEAGTLRAVVTANFGYPSPTVVAHCYAYAPPRLTVEVFPR